MMVSPSAISEYLVEQLAKPRLEHGDLGVGHRHVFRPVIRHRQCRPIALRPSTARTSGRGHTVIEIVEQHAARRMPWLRFLRGSHGATMAISADPLNDRSPRHITLPCSDLVLPCRLSANRSQQALIAW